MKILQYLLFIFLITQVIYAQSIVIETGSTIEVQTGADICAGEHGNITGPLTGGGTQCNDVLPVELVSFTAIAIGNSVTLNWKTETEVDNYGFDVERKAPLNHPQGGTSGKWEKIGFVEGYGNSNSPKEYSFEDSDPPSGIIQYRLKQIDTDGQFEYFPNAFGIEIEVTLPEEFALSQNYPNPFNPSTTIKYELPEKNYVNLIVYDILGSEVMTLVNEVNAPGRYSVQLDASALPSGTYFYRLQAGDFVETKKMILMK